jgi:glycosyltransferase involved in cell wall biosynthesis
MYAGFGPRMKKTILIYAHHRRAETDPNGYRTLQYSPYFNARGFEVCHITSRTPLISLIQGLYRADVVYIQRLLPDLLKLCLIRAFAKRIVFDFDDAVMYGMNGHSLTRTRRFRGIIRAANAVFCGNQFLVAEARKYRTENVFYIPTVVDTTAYPLKQHASAEPFVVGWMGSASTLQYLHDIKRVFGQAPSAAIFKAVADKAPLLEGVNCVFEPWSGINEKQSLLGFDMGIMPVRDDIWSKGKCGLKLIQYGAAGLPSVSHPLGVSKEIIVDGENGFLRQSEEGWLQAVELLRTDVALRETMGKKARMIAEERYCLRYWGPRVAGLVDSL